MSKRWETFLIDLLRFYFEKVEFFFIHRRFRFLSLLNHRWNKKQFRLRWEKENKTVCHSEYTSCIFFFFKRYCDWKVGQKALRDILSGNDGIMNLHAKYVWLLGGTIGRDEPAQFKNGTSYQMHLLKKMESVLSGSIW